MTTLAQVQTAATALDVALDGLLNTAIDVLNPNKATTPQIIALINDTRTKFDALVADTKTKAQVLGVI